MLQIPELHCELFDFQPIHPRFEKYENMTPYEKRMMSYYYTSLRHPDWKKHDMVFRR
jgi:hypothetical protein